MINKRIVHLDFLRFTAIILVLLFHLKVKNFDHGYLGVDIFFLISGFLMYAYFVEKFNYNKVKEFYVNRAFRIIPLYLISSFLLLLFSFFLVISPHEFYLIFKHYLFNSLLIPNIGFWLDESYFGSMTFRPALHYWSLGVEIQFYLIFPIIYFFIHKNLNSIVILLFIFSLLLYAAINLLSPKTSFFFLPTRLWEFLLGLYCAKFYLSQKSNNNYQFIGNLAFISIFFLIILIGSDLIYIREKYYFLLVIFICLTTSLVMICGLTDAIFKFNLIYKPIKLIARYSFSIYIIHFPIISFINYFPFKGNRFNFENDPYRILTIIIIIILSILSYNLIENKFRKGKNIRKLSIILLINILLSVIIFANIKNLYSKIFEEKKFNISFAYHDQEKFRCGKLHNLFKFNSTTCLISKENLSGKNVLLFGDSQADSIKYQLRKTSENFNLNLYLYQENLKLNSTRSYNLLLNELNSKNYNYVFVHNFPGNVNFQLFENILNENISKDIKFVYVMSPPIYDKYIPHVLFNTHVLSKSKHKYKNFEQHKVEMKSEYENVNRLSNYSNFNYIDIAKKICDKKVNYRDKILLDCRIHNEKFKPFYFDNHHFTITGSKELEDLFIEIFLN